MPGSRACFWKAADGSVLKNEGGGSVRSPGGKLSVGIDHGGLGWPSYGGAAVSYDGKTIMTYHFDRQPGGVKLWDAKTNKLIKEYPVKGGASMAALSPGGKTLIYWENGDWWLQDAVTGGSSEINRPRWIASFCAAFSPEGKFLILGSNNRVSILSADGKKLEATVITKRRDPGSSYALGPVAWSPGSKLIASGDSDVRLYEAATGRPIAVLVPLADKTGLSVSAAGHYRGTPPQAVARQLVYVVDTGRGQETLTPAEFEKKYGWKNDPEQVRLAP